MINDETTTDTKDDTSDDVAAVSIDMDSIEADIAAGVKAYGQLLRHASDDWNSWKITIIGLRALRNLAFSRSHSSDIKSYAYRQEIGALLRQRKYSVFDNIDKQTRSTCYKLMDNVEDISIWYEALPASEQLRWKHPDAIAKHCPRNLVAGGFGGNKPKAKSAKKRVVSAEEERLRALLIKVIKQLAKFDPEALELLDQVTPPGDPDDDLDDVFPDQERED